MSRFPIWKKFYKRNYYYHQYIANILRQIVEEDASVIEFGAKGGEILQKLKNKTRLGVNFSEDFPSRNKNIKLININSLGSVKFKFDYIILNHSLSEVSDIQNFIKKIKKVMHENSVVVVLSFNYLWKTIFDTASYFKLKYPYPKSPNWLEESDIKILFNLEGMKRVSTEKHMILPFRVPLLSSLLNKYVSQIPIINSLCITQVMMFRPVQKRQKCTVTVVIPARNEEGNIKGIIGKIPRMGSQTEVVFIEGHSKDNTLDAIKKEIKNYKGPIRSSYFIQKGTGKGDAVRLGFEKATGEMLMILDADLTVRPKELTKFYDAVIGGAGELVMGSRLVYPMEDFAMRNINYLGNKMFSLIFSFLLGQRIKDTLCGTKVIFKNYYNKIKKQRKFFGNFDPFGDFDLIFGAKKINLKILEIPVRYHERTYGKTNINRFTHGWLLFKMAFVAAIKLKFY